MSYSTLTSATRRVEQYAATLALDINDFNAALVACNLLQTPGGTPVVQRRLEGRLIARRLEQMPPQRVHTLFRELGRLRVNNRRTRAIIRDWLAARPDPGFDAVKYRAAVKAASRHAHLRHAGELGTFLFAPHRQTRYDTPILETWRRAHYTAAALYKLPYTVAEGLAAKHGIDRVLFLERIAPRLTRQERLRLQASADRHAVDVEADLAALPLTRLASYVLGLPQDERKDAAPSSARRFGPSPAVQWAGAPVPGAGWWRCSMTAFPRLARPRSGAVRSRSRLRPTTCSRRSPRRTRGCGWRIGATRCWSTRSAQPHWATASLTRFSDGRIGS